MLGSPDQIECYNLRSRYYTGLNGETYSCIGILHIPLPEYRVAYNI